MTKKYVFFGKTYETAQTVIAAILILPMLISLLMLFVLPVVQLIYLSFTNFSMTTPKAKFVGFSNYIYLIEDPKFLSSLLLTVIFSVYKLTLDVVLAMLIALALDSLIPFRRLLRIIYFAPVVVPVTASALIWIWFYDPGIGPLNQILNFFGFESLKWIYSEKTALLSVVIFSVWKGLGYNVVLLLAGLQNIPDSYSEAAKMDGASATQLFFNITLPLLSPTMSFIVMMGIVNTFKMFSEINIMTPDGGPMASTTLAVVYIYQQTFTNGRMGRGAAAAIVLFFIIFALTMVQRKFSQKTVFFD